LFDLTALLDYKVKVTKPRKNVHEVRARGMREKKTNVFEPLFALTGLCILAILPRSSL